MVVAGVFLKSNVARIVTLSGTKNKHSLVAERFNKLDLPKNPTQENVEVFVQAFKAFCKNNAIDKVIVNRRATSGKGAGGAGTFLMEGVLLAISTSPVEFVHAATIHATEKKQNNLKLSKPTTADLGKAYDLAFEGLT